MGTDTEERGWLVGRDDSLAEVLRAVEAGGGAVVVGPGGIGKTALVRAAAANSSFHVVKVRGSQIAGRTPFGALAWLISDLPEGLASSPLKLLQELESCFVRQAGGKRILLLVDNAEHLDDSTAMVLSQLVRRSAVTVLAAAEKLSASAPEFLALWTEGLLHRIDVPPLAAEQTRELMQKVLGGRVSSVAAQAMHRHSGGNPQMIRLLTQDQADGGSLVLQGDVWGLAKPLVFSGTVTELITSRLKRLPPAERSLVELLALSNEIPLTVAQTLFPAETLDSLEEGRVVDITDRVIRLASAGTAAAVAGAVRPGRSRELWEEVSPLVDPSLLGPSALDSFARWSLTCQGTLDPETATRAARLSTASDDPESALEFIRAVPVSRRSQAMLLEEVHALEESGHYPEALSALDRIAGVPEPGQLETWVELRLHQAGLLRLFPHHGDPVELLDSIGADLTAYEDQAAYRQAEAAVLLRRSSLAIDSGRTVDVPDRQLSAVASDAALSPTHRLRGLALQSQLLAMSGNGEEALQLLPAFRKEFRSTLAASAMDSAHLRMFQALIACGEYSLAEELVTELVDGGNRRAFRGSAGDAAIGLAHALAGRQDSAFSAVTSVSSQIRLQDSNDVLPLVQAAVGYVLALQGNAEEAGREAAAAAEYRFEPQQPVRLLTHALRLQALLAGDIPRLCGELRSLAGHCREQGMVAIALLCLAAAARHGDQSVARELAEAAAPATGRWARALWCFGAGIDRNDPALLLESAELASRTGNVLLCNDAARAALVLLDGRTDATSRGLARSALSHERASFRKLRDANTVHARMAALSPFEADLARRAASPATRTEISEALNLSPRTVDWHLGKIFDKLHVSGRSELAEVLG
ncbi:LuxR C-terminal-related transcriptional regulator [Arthrobacter sp. zg-Y1219]|uniref:helix-turn-helix transcriptional regulator n=1 Tax=Arthrobacter sp. zg-Y1219 TaxID=3049067 RepID=UPI0024C35B80|nr:LuxR family transcriptional regulator [Arthrobacter sp. zg-Y1219]MDK1360156.1 LuxR C-terminal-related transcriptional regulator [Arthrobacter sp. zg-Y1219]